MRERYIPALVMLVAGAITSILNIVNQVNLLEGLKRLLLVLIIFYFIGIISKAIIRNALKKPLKTEEEDQKPEENQTQGNSK